MCVVVVVESGCGWCERGREVKRRCLVSRCGRGLRREEAARLSDEAGAKEAEVFAVSERARGCVPACLYFRPLPLPPQQLF